VILFMDNLDSAASTILNNPICNGMTLDIVREVDSEAMVIFGGAYTTCLMLFVCGLDERGMLSYKQWDNMRNWNLRNYGLAHTN